LLIVARKAAEAMITVAGEFGLSSRARTARRSRLSAGWWRRQ
jgi:hypothetical protein